MVKVGSRLEFAVPEAYNRVLVTLGKDTEYFLELSLEGFAIAEIDRELKNDWFSFVFTESSYVARQKNPKSVLPLGELLLTEDSERPSRGKLHHKTGEFYLDERKLVSSSVLEKRGRKTISIEVPQRGYVFPPSLKGVYTFVSSGFAFFPKSVPVVGGARLFTACAGRKTCGALCTSQRCTADPRRCPANIDANNSPLPPEYRRKCNGTCMYPYGHEMPHHCFHRHCFNVNGYTNCK